MRANMAEEIDRFVGALRPTRSSRRLLRLGSRRRRGELYA